MKVHYCFLALVCFPLSLMFQKTDAATSTPKFTHETTPSTTATTQTDAASNTHKSTHGTTPSKTAMAHGSSTAKPNGSTTLSTSFTSTKRSRNATLTAQPVTTISISSSDTTVKNYSTDMSTPKHTFTSSKTTQKTSNETTINTTTAVSTSNVTNSTQSTSAAISTSTPSPTFSSLVSSTSESVTTNSIFTSVATSTNETKTTTEQSTSSSGSSKETETSQPTVSTTTQLTNDTKSTEPKTTPTKPSTTVTSTASESNQSTDTSTETPEAQSPTTLTTTLASPTGHTSSSSITASTLHITSTTQETITRPDFDNVIVSLRFFVTVNIAFKKELKDNSTTEYKSYSKEFNTKLQTCFKDTPGFTKLIILDFENGSTICNYEIQVNAKEFKQAADYISRTSTSNLGSTLILNTHLTLDKNSMEKSLTKGSRWLLSYCKIHGSCPLGFDCHLDKRNVQCYGKCFEHSNNHLNCIHGDCVIDPPSGNASCRCWTNATDIYTGALCDTKREEENTGSATITIISVFAVICVVLLLIVLGVVLYRYKKLKGKGYDSLKMGLVDPRSEEANHWGTDLMDSDAGHSNSQYDSLGETTGHNASSKLRVTKSGAKYSVRHPTETMDAEY